ncbi:hypothetical protein U8527_01045 [Kordia algicida OT-1]|uniref:Uncharacterized protein n=1 Tax=Kordia algicida OT-1 TaxID=391587 RepID=A9DS40_9FLAO|nr:hypothetical protein [Kordia algicida]EDP96882.1 hypothetical protein KAOT1_17003 [Kordia algicida OT-1]
MNVLLLTILGIVLIGGIIYLILHLIKKNNPSKTPEKPKVIQEPKSVATTIEKDNRTYSEKLLQTKKGYPFESWREAFFEYDMEQYTEENCNAAKAIFDNLIAGLLKIGEHGSEKEKLALFETAVNALNSLNDKVEGLIETGEREDLCELIDEITVAAGLNPENYADGEGLADLWREW